MGQVFGAPGKYDQLANLVQRETDGAVVVVCVLRGSKGDGFSVATRPDVTAATVASMPTILRMMADMIDAGGGPSGMSEEPVMPGRPE
jgi:lauroyl/myristoyl acyltransferase